MFKVKSVNWYLWRLTRMDLDNVEQLVDIALKVI